jgi:GntR family uxuAB operon transcriptional repressor
MSLKATASDKNSRLYIKVADSILNDLKTTKTKVGSRLSPERKLAEEFSVSRTVIREAMVYLELIGIAEIRKGSGVYIISSSPETKTRHELNFTPFEFLDARRSLEPELAKRAAQNCNDEILIELNQCLAMMKASVHFSNSQLRHEASVDADKQFHFCIARASNNPILIQFHDDLMKQHMQGDMWNKLDDIADNPGRTGHWISDHQNIIDAIKSKDENLAFQTMFNHINNVIQKLIT